MTIYESTPDAWTRIDATKDGHEIPDEYPDDITPADGPFGWENKNTGTTLWLTPNQHDDDEFDDWLVTGENSVVEWAESVAAARRAAIRYMARYKRPSPMI